MIVSRHLLGLSAGCDWAANTARWLLLGLATQPAAEPCLKTSRTYSFANIDKFSTAGLVTRLTTDVTNLQNAYQMLLRMCVRAPATHDRSHGHGIS